MVGLIIEEMNVEIKPILVPSGLRGRGIGRVLLKYVIEEMRKLESLFLSVRPVAGNR